MFVCFDGEHHWPKLYPAGEQAYRIQGSTVAEGSLPKCPGCRSFPRYWDMGVLHEFNGCCSPSIHRWLCTGTIFLGAGSVGGAQPLQVQQEP